jgi:hypothetical protein
MTKFAQVLCYAALCGGLMTSIPAKADFYFTGDDRLVLKRYVVEPAPVTGDVVFYERGTVIPETVRYEQLPLAVTRQLTAPPQGDVYVSYGGNVYLVDTHRRVIDSIELY